MEVSLIIPAHNEESRLMATLDLYRQVLDTRYGADWELLVVANGCSDATVSVASAYAATMPHLRIIDISAPVGKGGAVLEGFRQAVGRHVLFVDADGATAPESLLALLDQMEDHDLVIGSRRLQTSTITQHQPLTRQIFGQVFASTVRFLFGMPYHDTQCGAKAFQRDAAKRMVTAVQEHRWAFDVDLLLCAQSFNFRVAEHPVIWADQPGSRLRVAKTLREVCQSLWRLKMRHANIMLEPFTTYAQEVVS